MPVFFIRPDQVHDGTVTLTDPALLTHLRASLRVRVGETLRVAIEGERRMALRIVGVERKMLRGVILEEEMAPPGKHPRISLGQAVLKRDRMDWLIEKSAELGVASLTPLVTARTIARPTPARMESQRARWQRIALEAAQQSEQWAVPRIQAPCDATEFFERPSEGTLNLILTERRQGQSLAALLLPQGNDSLIGLAVGPEGGWTPDEVDLATAAGFASVTLGLRILRAETAAIAALSILQSRLGELG